MLLYYKYGNLPQQQIKEHKKFLTNAIFKLLPYKEQNYPHLDRYFTALLFRINGLNHLFYEQAEIITLMSILEGARTEKDFDLYRKAIFDACDVVKKLKEVDENE